jgi:hypothetical protein
MALLPHIALLSQMVANPVEEFDPHMAEDPHIADDPHIAEEPHMAEFDVTNCEEPQTAALPHIAELFQTEDGSELRNTLPELGS